MCTNMLAVDKTGTPVEALQWQQLGPYISQCVSSCSTNCLQQVRFYSTGASVGTASESWRWWLQWQAIVWLPCRDWSNVQSPHSTEHQRCHFQESVRDHHAHAYGARRNCLPPKWWRQVCFHAYHDDIVIHRRCIPDDENRWSVLSKAKGQLARVALVLHRLEQAVSMCDLHEDNDGENV